MSVDPRQMGIIRTAIHVSIHSSKLYAAAWSATGAVRSVIRRNVEIFINTGTEMCQERTSPKIFQTAEGKQDETTVSFPTLSSITLLGCIEDLLTGWVLNWDWNSRQRFISLIFRVQTCYRLFCVSLKSSIMHRLKSLSMLCDAESMNLQKRCNNDGSLTSESKSFLFKLFLVSKNY